MKNNSPRIHEEGVSIPRKPSSGDAMIKQLKELEEERDKTTLELYFAYLNGRIEQLRLDIKYLEEKE